jgi:hypothetical protein
LTPPRSECGPTDGAAAASVAAAQQFAQAIGEVLACRADAAAAAGDHLVATSRAIWELVALYFVEPGDGTGGAVQVEYSCPIALESAWFQTLNL